MLAAHSLGIGSCPIGMSRHMKEEKDLVGKLNFPEDYELVLAMVFGYSNEKPELKPRGKDAVSWIE
jgi:nitroreductase